jgi:hypothetical protein
MPNQMKTPPEENIFAQAEKLLGKSPDDELRAILEALGKWPIPPFGPEELTIYLEDKPRGFCLVFDDSSTVQHPVAANKPPQTPIFVGCFFYAEGVDGYHAFKGALPYGISWSDNASSMVSKIGPPKHEIKNKKTGLLSSHRWQIGQWMLTARYTGGGSAIRHLHLGII